MDTLMKSTLFKVPYATLRSEPTNPEWHRLVDEGKIIQNSMEVNLPVSLQDIKRGYTIVPNLLYDTLHPPTNEPRGITITNNLHCCSEGWFHTHNISLKNRKEMLEKYIESYSTEENRQTFSHQIHTIVGI